MFTDFKSTSFAIDGQIASSFVENVKQKFDTVNLATIKSVASVLEDISKYSNLPLNDSITKEVEGFVALFVTLCGCNNVSSALSAIFLYVRSHFETSVTKSITNYLLEFIEFEPHSNDDDPDWLRFIKSAQDNWDVCKTNKLFGHLSKIMGVLVTMGLCKSSALTLSICDFKLFEPDLRAAHNSATSIIDAVLSTVTFFVEGIYLSIKTGSFKPLLFSSKNALELDEEFSTIVLWWDLVKNGNLERVVNVAESEFDNRLERLCTRIKPLVATVNGFEKKLLLDKVNKLLKIKNDYITLKISSGVRKAPFVIELYGESSQGKTTFGDQIVDALLCSAGLPLGKEYRASYNPSDKYMSNWSTNKLVLVMDDVANDKANFVERPPTRVIIDVCNNQPFYANMADLESKGKVFVEPAIAVVNTNVKHLDAYTYSNCPYSIQRRMHVVITVKAKPEFQYMIDGKTQGIDPAKIRAFYAKQGAQPTFDDIWLLTVEKARQPKDMDNIATYVPLEWNGTVLKDVDFSTVVQYLIERFREHRFDQDCILDRMRSRQKVVETCGVDGCYHIKGYCDKHKMEPHYGLENFRNIVTNTASDIYNFIDNFRRINNLCDIVPDWCCDYFTCIYYMRSMLFYYKLCTILNVFILCCGACTHYSLVFVLLFCVLQLFMHKLILCHCRHRLRNTNIISSIILPSYNANIQLLCKSIGLVGILYLSAKFYRKFFSMHEHGSLEPKSVSDIMQRDSEESPWTKVVARTLPTTGKMWSTSTKDMIHLVSKNLVYGTVVVGDKTMMVNALFIKSNLVVIPSHYFSGDKVLDVTFRKNNPTCSGGKFATRISREASYHIPNTDLVVCYSTTGGSFKDLTPYLPMGPLRACQFTMLWRAKDGELSEYEGVSIPKRTSNGIATFDGGEYANLSTLTFRGMCGATLISHGRVTTIMGFHLGGKSGTRKGCYGTLTREDFELAEAHLRDVEGVLLTGSAEKFEVQVLEKQVIDDGPIHPKSPLNYMPHDSQVEYYGQCPGRALSFSSVRVTPISHIVTDICGVPNIWGPPKMKPDWFGWQTCLANLAVPALPYAHDLLSICVKDYKSALLDIFNKPLWRDSKPLTYYQNTCGIPGKKFMDGIKLNTSIGFPLTGSKRNYIIQEEPDDVWQEKWRFTDDINVEIDRCEECYRRGERAYTIAKACKKDEVLSKDKCRIFYGNPIALTFLIRKYYLPIIRVLQMNPLVSECAVGINSHGPEWEELHQFVFKHGENRLIGGDYGKYDQKIPSQLILASLRIMIDFAKQCNYCDDDINIMEAMAGDIVYAIIAFNGDLIGLTEGTHISGNSLTVVINGICGSLNQRAYFYTLFKPESYMTRKPFRDYVNLITYGDDNIGSVHPDIEEFGIKGLSEFLKEYGQIYTMPDKESELVRFLDPLDFEFLKRKSVFCPKRKCHIGALIEKSIFKSLHCFLRDKSTLNTEEMACALNIDTALREWFNHGEEVYIKRLQDMRDVAKEAKLTYLCTRLDLSYDDLVEEWNNNYSKQGHSKPL